MSGYCKDCKYVVHDDGWFCGYLQKSSGILTNTYPNGHCKQFAPKTQNAGHGGKNGENDKCFLTSACVDYLGKTDDCEELTMLRAFRDGYMSKNVEGEKLVKEYYEVAPTIVERIEASDKRDMYYADIYNTIQKCVELIKSKVYEETQKEYVAMVMKYKKEFNI